MFTYKTEIGADFNVYGSSLSNNIRLSHRKTPTNVIVDMQ